MAEILALNARVLIRDRGQLGGRELSRAEAGKLREVASRA
jgi:hypothetical protein